MSLVGPVGSTGRGEGEFLPNATCEAKGWFPMDRRYNHSLS